MPSFSAIFDQRDLRRDRRRRLADSLLLGGASSSPVQHPLQGVARLAQALSGKIQNDRMDREDEDRRKSAQDALAAALDVQGSATSEPSDAPARSANLAAGGGAIAQNAPVTPQPARLGGGFDSPESFDRAINILAANPDTAPFALQMKLNRLNKLSQPPSSVQEFEFFQSLPKEDQDTFLKIKRANPALNLGDKFVIPSQSRPGETISEFNKGISPERVIQDDRVIELPGVPGQSTTATNASGRSASGTSITNLPLKQTQTKALNTMSENLGSMVKAYLKLDELGGIVNPDKGLFENLRARASSSEAGQTVGGAVGTEEQSLRQRIENMQPLLINSIRQATDMSAKAMDSNRELQFYLQAASDPKRDLISNLAAIDVLDRTYGTGGTLDRILSPETLVRVREQSDLALETRPIPGPKLGDQEPQGSLPDDITEEDIQHTMKVHGLSRDEVLHRLGVGGN